MTKVLIVVEDDPQISLLIARISASAGYETLRPRDGADALRLIREVRPEAVITDIMMPDCNGIELIADLRREFPALHIIAMSGGGTWHDLSLLDAAREAGADDILPKPFRVAELVGVLRHPAQQAPG